MLELRVSCICLVWGEKIEGGEILEGKERKTKE